MHGQLQVQCIGEEAFASTEILQKTLFWKTWLYQEVLSPCCECGIEFDVGGENVPNTCTLTQKPLCCDCGWKTRTHKCLEQKALPPASVLPGSVPAVPLVVTAFLPVSVFHVASESLDAASPSAESVEVAVYAQPPASVLAVPLVVSVTALLYSFVCRICLFVL